MMDELRSDIKELKKEVIETRNMNIKTDNNMRSIHAEMKKISSNQKTFEKKMRVVGIGTYILFVVIISVAAIFLSSIKASVHKEEIATLNERLKISKEETKQVKNELDARYAAEKRAIHVLKLIKRNKKKDAVAEFRKIDLKKLSEAENELLKEKIDVFLKDLAKKHFDQGVNQWRIGGYKSALQEFKQSKSYLLETEFKAEVLYYSGLSELQLKKDDEGIESLKAAIAIKLRKDLADQARIKIADSYMGKKRYDEALQYMKGIPKEAMGYWTKQAINMKITYVNQRIATEKKQKEAQKTPQ